MLIYTVKTRRNLSVILSKNVTIRRKVLLHTSTEKGHFSINVQRHSLPNMTNQV